MNYKGQVLKFLKKHKKGVTLSKILEQRAAWTYTFRQRISELRAEGHDISFERGKLPGQNRYILLEK